MRVYSFSAPAGEFVHVPLPGAFVRILSAEGALEIEFSNGERTEIENGIGVQVPAFEWLALKSPTAQQVKISVSRYPVSDNRIERTVTGAASNNYGAVLVGVAATLVVAANKARRSVLLQNLGAVDVYVGSSAAVTAANGIRVIPGGAYEASNISALYAIAGTAGQDVRFSEDVN